MFSDVDGAPDPGLAVAYLEATARSLAEVKRELVRRLRVVPGERVLDIGCGAGHDLALLAARGAAVAGVDPSVHMVEASRRRCPEAEVVVADGASLPYTADSFDACRIERVLQHVPDPGAVLAEAARVLRRDGRIVVFEPDWGSLAIDSHDTDTATAMTNAVMSGVRHPRVGLQLRRLLVEAGFTVEEVVVDVGSYASMAEIQRGIDLNNVGARAVASGLLSGDELTNWLEEMHERSERGTFQGIFNRMIAVARR